MSLVTANPSGSSVCNSCSFSGLRSRKRKRFVFGCQWKIQTSHRRNFSSSELRSHLDKTSKVSFSVFFRSTHRWWKSEEKQTTRNGANRIFIGWWIGISHWCLPSAAFRFLLSSVVLNDWKMKKFFSSSNHFLPFIYYYVILLL